MAVLCICVTAAGIGCGGGRSPQPEPFPRTEVPVLVVELTGLRADPGLPSRLAQREGVAQGHLSPSGFPADTAPMAEAMALDLMAEGYLCLLADVRLPAAEASRSNIVLRSAGEGVEGVAVSPEELQGEVDPLRWRSFAGRQGVVRELLGKYRPDAVIMRLEPDSAGQVEWLLSYWADELGSEGMDMVFYSPPAHGDDYRGWVALLGPSFRGGQIEGLTYRGLRSTVRVVFGLPDTVRASKGVAAWAHIEGGAFQ